MAAYQRSSLTLTLLQLPATHFAARIRECPDSNKIHLVQSFSRKPQPDLVDEIVARTLQQYGIVREALRAKGRPLPQNDMWIAALALQHNMVLVTRDAHFNEIAGLTVVAW